MLDRDALYEDAKRELARLNDFPTDTHLEWLRQAYLSQHSGLAQLRKTIDELREFALDLVPNEQALTVAECHLLNCCRICRCKPPRVPTVLSFGDEYACEQCLKERAS